MPRTTDSCAKPQPQDEVFKVIADNTERQREVLLYAMGKLPTSRTRRTCPCGDALASIKLPFELP
jgi:5'-methylthioadenosine phosphorylase